jgi:hypothetical protein
MIPACDTSVRCQSVSTWTSGNSYRNFCDPPGGWSPCNRLGRTRLLWQGINLAICCKSQRGKSSPRQAERIRSRAKSTCSVAWLLVIHLRP